MRPPSARSNNRQLYSRCSQQTYHCPSQQHYKSDIVHISREHINFLQKTVLFQMFDDCHPGQHIKSPESWIEKMIDTFNTVAENQHFRHTAATCCTGSC